MVRLGSRVPAIELVMSMARRTGRTCRVRIAAAAWSLRPVASIMSAPAAIRARDPGARLWAGSPAAADADGRGVTTGGPATPVAAAIARAAVLTWLGTPAIRTRHVLPVRRAIDMTSSIAGTRLPSLATRGLG